MRGLRLILLTGALAAGCNQVGDISPDKAKQLLRTTGCTNCHDRERPLVGPPFAAVAARYAGQATAEEALARSITQGSQGKWGRMIMPPQARLEPEERKAMIRWILALETAPSSRPEGSTD